MALTIAAPDECMVTEQLIAGYSSIKSPINTASLSNVSI
jgi:hypothetical protein